MTLPNPQVAIGTTTEWYDLEIVPDSDRPMLGPDDSRPLLRGSVAYRYWTIQVGMPNNTYESVTGRLLVCNDVTNPPSGAVPVTPGKHRTYIRVPDNPEIEAVEAGRLFVANQVAT